MKNLWTKTALAIATSAALIETAAAGTDACNAGEFSATGEAPCMACGLGTFQPAPGQTACTDAGPGFFVDQLGQTAQSECTAGFFQSQSGASACDPAPPGRFVAGNQATEATECSVGRFQMFEGQTSCVAADPGTFVNVIGATQATQCATGTFQPAAGQEVCLDAGPGFFVGELGQIEQTECAAGTFQSQSGASACDPAPPGRFVAGTQATEAIACDVGRFQMLEGQTSCVDADAGSFVNVTGATLAMQCSAGTFQPNTGQSACLDAGPGFFVGELGQIEQTECAAGTFQAQSGTSACDPAPPGRFVPGTQATEAIACEPGTFQDQEGQQSCNPADPGSFVDISGSSSQTACPVGFFQPDAGALDCDTSPPGRFVANVGATQAEDCLPGSFQPESGQANCISAESGFFVADAGATAALACPAGSVSFTGSAACRQAPTAGPNVVSPEFDSSLGRGGEVSVPQVLSAPTDALLIDISNAASALGQPSPLTRLTLNALSSDGAVSSTDLATPVTLDEGESVPVRLDLVTSSLGLVQFPFQIQTDQTASLGGEGRAFDFLLTAPVDGSDVAVSIYADRPSVAPAETFFLRLDLSNPGQTDAANNQLTFQVSDDTLCQFSSESDSEVATDPLALSTTGTDTVDLPARANAQYLASCVSSAQAPNGIAFSASVMPNSEFADADNLNNSDSGSVSLIGASTGNASLAVDVLSQSSFLEPDSEQQVVYEITNNGPDDLTNGNFTLLVSGLADLLNLSCSDQPGVACGTLRRAGRRSFAVETALNLAQGQRVQITLDIRVRTLEAQTVQIAAIATVPPGWQQPTPQSGESVIRTTGGIFNDSFE
ncbi:MAG: hypothetical protein AB8B96_18655 [Lysobacterales bacterium]